MELNKIVHSLVKELKDVIMKDVLKKLREELPNDIASIVKEVLVAQPRISVESWISVDDICQKYHCSRTHVNDICNLFGVKRKQVGRYNMVNEQEFLNGHDRPMDKPVFLRRRNAA